MDIVEGFYNVKTKEENITTRTLTEEEVLQIEENNKKEVNQKKLMQLINWFNDYFDKQLNQSFWQDDFTVSNDPYFKDENGNPRTYSNIEELKAQAKIVRDEIRNLRK